jgi:hypothetical protein
MRYTTKASNKKTKPTTQVAILICFAAKALVATVRVVCLQNLSNRAASGFDGSLGTCSGANATEFHSA